MFMGDTWPMSDFPPSDGDKFMAWVGKTADPEATTKKVQEVQRYLGESKGAKKYGSVGFCWGGCVSLMLAGARARARCGRANMCMRLRA